MTTKTKTAEQKIADAMRSVSVKLVTAYEEGHRSSQFDIWDMTETLLAIADELDPE